MEKIFLRFFFLPVFFLMVLWAAAFAFLPFPGTIPVLMYHFIGTPEDARSQKNNVTREGFEHQMAFLHRFGYRVLSMKEYDEILMGHRKPRGREILITFDDGSPSFEKGAFPSLQRYRQPCTLFLISESVKKNLPASMSEEVVRKLLASGLITIGSHSKTHPFLSQMTDEQIEDEVAGSKKDLEAMFGVPIDSLAYPLGDFDARVMNAAQKSGYHFAFTTSSKKLKGHKPNLFNLTREKISYSADNPVVFWFKISGLYQFFKQGLHQARYGSAY